MRTTHRTVCRALATACLAAAMLLVPSVTATSAQTSPQASAAQAPVPQSPAPQSYAGPCTDDLGVTVVVDFQGLGSHAGHSGATVVRCAPGSGGQPFSGSGLDAFQAAGLQIGGTTQHGLSVVCRVNGRPAADEPLAIPGHDGYTEQCTQMPPATAFWSYWQADNNGSWQFSQLGVTSSTARAGGFEALSFSLNSTSAPPRTAPSRPSPEPEPTPEPTPTPPPAPEPAPPAEPEPAQPGEPAPGQPAPVQPPADPDPSPSDPPAAEDPATGESRTAEPAPETAGSSEPADPSDPTDLGGLAAGSLDAGVAAAAPGDEADQDAAAATSSGAAQPSPGTTEPDDEPVAASEEFTDPTTAGSGAGALWVTFGILLVLGGLAALARRRRPADDGPTHEVVP